MAVSTLSDFSGAISLTAPVGGTTAGVVCQVSTVTKLMAYPYDTAASGATFNGYVGGDKIVKAAPIITTAAIALGAALAWSTATSQFTNVTTAAVAVVAHAAAAASSGDLTCDVILCLPSALSPA